MRLNSKTAKELRAASSEDPAARYRNQSKTPSKPEFPGVARIYSVPVYMKRPAVKTTYEYKDGRWVRVLRRVVSMAAVGYKGKQQIIPLEMVERTHPTVIDGPDGPVPNPKAGQKYHEVAVEQVPVTKPIAATGPKKIYRQLKRMHKQGLLRPEVFSELFTAFTHSETAKDLA